MNKNEQVDNKTSYTLGNMSEINAVSTILRQMKKNTLNFLIRYCGNNLFFFVMLSEDVF